MGFSGGFADTRNNWSSVLQKQCIKIFVLGKANPKSELVYSQNISIFKVFCLVFCVFGVFYPSPESLAMRLSILIVPVAYSTLSLCLQPFFSPQTPEPSLV